MGMIDENARLSRSVDVASMSFEAIMLVLRTFTRQVLLTKENIEQLKVDPGLRPQLLQVIESAERRKDPDPEKCQADRVAAWNLQMSLPKGGSGSRLAEVVVLCTYDRESAEFDTFGADAMIESIMTSICALGAVYCVEFVDFAIKQLGQ